MRHLLAALAFTASASLATLADQAFDAGELGPWLALLGCSTTAAFTTLNLARPPRHHQPAPTKGP